MRRADRHQNGPGSKTGRRNCTTPLPRFAAACDGQAAAPQKNFGAFEVFFFFFFAVAA